MEGSNGGNSHQRKQKRKAQERIINAVPKKLLAESSSLGKENKPKHPAVVYVESIGGGLSVVGLASTFPFPKFYWYGIATFFIGLLFLAVGALLESWRIGIRLTLCFAWLAIAALIAINAVSVSAPLEIDAFSNPAPYSVGTDVLGIKWELGMSELRLVIHNRTSNDYDDVDIVFRPDVPTRKIAQVTKFPDLSFTLATPSDGTESAYVQINGNAADVYASPYGFRMRCPKIPKRTTIEIVVALIEPPQPPPTTVQKGMTIKHFVSITGTPDDLVPKQPTRVYVDGDYTVLNRPHHVELTYGVSH